MTYSIQEAVRSLFNTAEIPLTMQTNSLSYVDLLVACPKKSLLYYTEEEHEAIPWWSIRQSVRTVQQYHDPLWETVWQQIASQLDRRQPVILAVDDYVVRRYGKQAYWTGYFYSNAHGGVVWGNALVDTVIRHGTLNCPIKFEIHHKNGPLTVWQRGLNQVHQVHETLRTFRVKSNRIWVVGDCKYGNRAMGQALRDLGGFYLLGLPKNRSVELFGRSKRLDEFFASQPERRLTVSGKTYRYKISTANVNGWGRQRLLAVLGPGQRWKFYVCNKLDATPLTLLQRMRDRWVVEDTHRSLKNYHGGEHFHVWTRPSVLGHFELAYLSCAVASLERGKKRKQGKQCTMEQLHRAAIRWSRDR